MVAQFKELTHPWEGGAGGLGLCHVMGPPRTSSCTRMSGACVTCVTRAGCATMTWRGGRGGGVIGKCAATRVVTWVSPLESGPENGFSAQNRKKAKDFVILTPKRGGYFFNFF